MSLKVKLNFMGKSVEAQDISLEFFEAHLREGVQFLLNSYAPLITARARELLRQRLLHPEKSTGRLSRSIRYRIYRNGTRLTIYAGAPYGGFVEEGTRFMEGKNMIGDAVHDYQGEINLEVQKLIAEALREAARS